MTAAEKLLRLEAEATPGPWSIESLPTVSSLGEARLIVAMRSLARPLAEWVEAFVVWKSHERNHYTTRREVYDWHRSIGTLSIADDKLLAAFEAAMKEIEP